MNGLGSTIARVNLDVPDVPAPGWAAQLQHQSFPVRPTGVAVFIVGFKASSPLTDMLENMEIAT